MPDRELLEQDDGAPGLRERARRREAHHPGADDGDLGVGAGAHPPSLVLS